MTCIMGQTQAGRDGERERGRQRVLATCCHTNLCIPKLGEKNKTSTLLPLPLPDSKLPGLKTLSSHTAGLRSPLSRFLPLCPPCPLLSAEINCIRKVAPRRTCAMVAWQRAGASGARGRGNSVRQTCAYLSLEMSWQSCHQLLPPPACPPPALGVQTFVSKLNF